MALAILRFEQADNGTVRFHADIGHNRYYHYEIGDDEVRDKGGIAVLAAPQYRSAIVGPVRNSTLGRTSLEIPLELFNRSARFVQLTSIHEPPDIGAAISDIVEVPFGVLPPGLPLDEERRRYRPMPRSRISQPDKQREVTVMPQQMQKPPRVPINVHSAGNSMNGYTRSASYQQSHSSNGTPYAVPFAYHESRYSDAMFLGAIGSLLSSALPVISQVVSGLGGAGGVANILGGLFGGSGGAGGGAGGIANILGSLLGGGGTGAPAANPSGANPQSVTPELMRLITDVFKALDKSQSSPSVPSKPSGSAPQSTQSSLARAYSGNNYSQQMIAPALLAALPALMPLLEKVMNPATMNAIGSNFGPKASIGAITDSIKDIGGMNIQAYQNILNHIKDIMPSSDTTPLLNHLLAVTESLSAPSILPSYRRIEAVSIQYILQKAAMVRGREQVLYHNGTAQGIAFPVTVETPRPIRGATLYMIVKEAETLRIIIEKQWDVTNVGTGTLATVPHLSNAETSVLSPGVEYLVSSYLVWNNKQGELIGTSRTEAIQVVGEYTYQGAEAEGEIVPLNDVERFRSYWHKVWQETFSREKRRWEWDCKYYYTLDPKRRASVRLETVIEETTGGGRRVQGRMKTGLCVSAAELNALLPQISTYPSLNTAQLEALSAPVPVAAFGRAARFKAQFRGSVGDSVALWIYPEMRIQPIVLLKAQTPDENGLVMELVEETVHFPIPSLAHFVGVTTETNPSLKLDDFEEF